MAASETPLFGFRLVSPVGDTLGTLRTDVGDWQPGDTITAGGVLYRVRSVIPAELIARFVDAPHHGVLEVEPL